jgi:hypothetical protein
VAAPTQKPLAQSSAWRSISGQLIIAVSIRTLVDCAKVLVAVT